MIGVKYTSASLDSSGYASAARGYIAALLDTKEIDLTLNVVSFETQKTTHGELGKLIMNLIDKPIEYKIHIIHLTPENFARFKEPGKYNIGYCAWETDKLPDDWAEACNLLNELWVPSQYNVDVFRNSGVTIPIKKVPHGIEEPDIQNAVDFEIGQSAKTFVFYSIFQFIERKNPVGLLKAYLTEFQNNEDVNLVIKTYRMNTSKEEQEKIKASVLAVKKALNLPKYPPITFYGNLLPREHILGLHKRGDCFVFPVRSEGFGIPAAEAMAFGNPCISTNYGGCLEFMNEDNSFLVDYMLTPCAGMIFGKYNGSMLWAEPSIMDIRKHMRYVYENQKEAKKIALRGQQTIQKKFNWKVIGQLILTRIKELTGISV